MTATPFTGQRRTFWEHQPFFSWTQPNPVQNQWYTVLDLGNQRGVRIYVLTCNVGGAVAETIELRITADGKVLTCSPYTGTAVVLASLDFTSYDIILNTFSPATDLMHKSAFLLESRSIKIEMRKTTAAGTANLYCGAVYAIMR